MAGAKVAQYAIRKNSMHNDKFNVKILKFEDHIHLTKREGQTYLRKKKIVTWRNRDLQSFSPLRFLPPLLMGFQSRAIVIDPDIFCLVDIYELITRDMKGKAICARHVQGGIGRPNYFNSSVMLMDCAKLKHWKWNEKIDQMFRHEWDYGQWIFLRSEDQSTIGTLEPEWNDCDTLTSSTKMLHTTERSTQPWKTGLPIDYNLNYQSNSDRKWGLIPQRWIDAAKNGFRTVPQERYKQHPDPKQEELFFTLVGECLDAGIFTETELRSEMKKKHIRHDSLEMVQQVRSNRMKAA